jgi:thymidylate kinase
MTSLPVGPRLLRADRPTGETGFSVLLGPDYAGKSSVLLTLARAGWQCVSYDDELVRPECSEVNELLGGFVPRAVRGIGTYYSPDFVVTLLQTAVVYLRDQVLRAPPGAPVIVDSYYYKILAKCMLTGLVNEEMFAWWRSFPRPRQVIFLDVDPETAWQRCGQGARSNPFEHYGAAPTREGFVRFQTDLRQLMLAEVDAVRLAVIEATGGVEHVADAVIQHVSQQVSQQVRRRRDGAARLCG